MLYALSEIYFSKLLGRTDTEDALKKLDNLIQEVIRMATTQVIKATGALPYRLVAHVTMILCHLDVNKAELVVVNNTNEICSLSTTPIACVVNAETWSQGTRKYRMLENGSLHTTLWQTTTPHVRSTIMYHPCGSSETAYSRVGCQMVSCCGSTENVCSSLISRLDS